MARTLLAISAAFCITTASAGQEYPSARISNGVLTADFYLPDPLKGSYRATRFDWSGIIRNVIFQGHSFFGQWYDHHDPLVHDAITGPVNVFDNTGSAVGYAVAKPGESFVRIGVGHVRKPDEPAYRETSLYKIVDPGEWRIERASGSIRFTQTLPARNGYGYIYTKTVTLTPGKPEMTIAQHLQNTGTKAVDTSVFNHGFFQIDQEPAGPGLVWTFPFMPTTTRDFSGMAEVRGNRILYLRELRPGERVLAPIEGYGATAEDHQFSIENLKTGAGVRVRGDHPIARLNFWSRRMGYSPEATIRLHINPGQAAEWQTRYEFYIAAEKGATK